MCYIAAKDCEGNRVQLEGDHSIDGLINTANEQLRRWMNMKKFFEKFFERSNIGMNAVCKRECKMGEIDAAVHSTTAADLAAQEQAMLRDAYINRMAASAEIVTR